MLAHKAARYPQLRLVSRSICFSEILDFILHSWGIEKDLRVERVYLSNFPKFSWFHNQMEMPF
jgi:hypothetical protein